VVGSRFSLWEITSGLPDDSREADDRAAERALRDLRGRVKAARAMVAKTPRLAETLHLDGERAARFYARFGISEAMFRGGVPACGSDAQSHGDSQVGSLPLGSSEFSCLLAALPSAHENVD
jgi:hypothetical protein